MSLLPFLECLKNILRIEVDADVWNCVDIWLVRGRSWSRVIRSLLELL